MVRTIKSKILLTALLLILSIQIVSSIFQYQQVKSIFYGEFVLGAQNMAQAPFLDLSKRMSRILKAHGDETITKAEREEDILDSLLLFISIIQLQLFDQILNSREDLLEIKFVDFRGTVLTHSYKKESSSIHQNISDNVDLKVEEEVIAIVNSQKQGTAVIGEKVYIFVPKSIGDNFLGGMILIFSNERIVNARNKILMTSIILVIVFMCFSIFLLFILLMNVLTKPIAQMIDLMKRLANGDYNLHFEIKNQDEIGEMGCAVNEVVAGLQAILGEISNTMGKVEKGDLSQLIEVSAKGELAKIKDRINISISMLSRTVRNVLNSSQSVQTSANELSNSAGVLSSSTVKQAATLEQISSSIAEIESHSKQNSNNSLEAKNITNETLKLVDKGRLQMEEMQNSMHQINSTSNDIKKIIKIIDEIAFQTNLLALNAAVEAARAGKYGKGFAVVAEEVGNLAARSAEAAKDTAMLIESSTKEVETGVKNADKTQTILNEIVDEVKKSHKLVSNIANASQEQNSSMSEINLSVGQVNETVQQNSAISQETASASGILLSQSDILLKEISKFIVLENDEELLNDIELK